MKQRAPFNIAYVIFAFFAVLFLQNLWVQYRTVEPLPYSDFLAQLKAGNVEELAIEPNVIEGTLKTPLPDGRRRFATTRVETDLARDLSAYDVKFSGVVQSSFLHDVLGWVVPTLLFVAIWYFLIRRLQERGGMGAGLLSIGKSKAKVYVETDVKITFEDVAGVDEAKDELREVVGFLKDPAKYGRLGARIPKGVLLVGPPGTGKTLLARAVAGEAGVAFFSINGSEFVEMFVGVGAARVRDLFEQARRKAPAIIFIDELDALGHARGAYAYGGNDEKEQTLNQLLVELDGFDSSSALVLLAATNRPEILDPALLRAGRFDRQVLVDRPDKPGRIDIVNLYLKNHKLDADVSAEKVAALTPGFTGADLANLVNEAALVATRRNAPAVSMSDFTEAVERTIAGLEKKKRVLSPKERETVAHHEMGHALVAMSLPGADAVHKVSIIPRGVGALGYTIQRPSEDRYVVTREELLDRMAVLLGGRAAEWVMFKQLSTGAADDLAKATDIARDMATRFGMDETLGPVSLASAPSPFLSGPPGFGDGNAKRYSDETARAIDDAVQKTVAAAFDRTVAILGAHRDVLVRGAKLLLERETLDESALKPLRDAMQPSGAVAAE